MYNPLLMSGFLILMLAQISLHHVPLCIIDMKERNEGTTKRESETSGACHFCSGCDVCEWRHGQGSNGPLQTSGLSVGGEKRGAVHVLSCDGFHQVQDRFFPLAVLHHVPPRVQKAL